MSFLATAVIGAGVIGAGASIYGANKAADAQTSASNNSIAAQQQQFGVTQAALQPYIQQGQDQFGTFNSFANPDSATSPLNRILSMLGPDQSSPLSALLRLTTPGADQNATLEQTPGYEFSKEQGMKAVTSGLAARGLAGPGGALAKGGANYAEGLAGTTWQSVVNALQGALQTGVGGLQNAYSSGTNALQGSINSGASSAGALGGASTQVGQGVGNNLVGIGNAQAGAATATGNAIGGAANSVGSGLLLNQLVSRNATQGYNPNTGLYSGNAPWVPSNAPYNN